MQYRYATKREFSLSLLLALAMGFGLAMGFLSMTRSLYQALMPWIPRATPLLMQLKELAFFPLCAAIFALSLPKPKSSFTTSQFGHLVRISLLPLCIAFLYGRARGLDLKWNFQTELIETAWYVLFVPFGEELLFRGWFYALTERLWPRTFLTLTNPLPVAVWATSCAFALWHIQNLGFNSTPQVFFQVFYTFLTGIWLGVIRWKSNQIWPCILCHAAINFLAGI